MVAVTGVAGRASQGGWLLVGPGGVGAHGRVAVPPSVWDGLDRGEEDDGGDESFAEPAFHDSILAGWHNLSVTTTRPGISMATRVQIGRASWRERVCQYV